MCIMKFYSFDLDFDPVTFLLKLDLDIVKIYVSTEHNIPSFGGSKLVAGTDTQSGTQTHRPKHRQT